MTRLSPYAAFTLATLAALLQGGCASDASETPFATSSPLDAPPDARLSQDPVGASTDTPNEAARAPSALAVARPVGLIANDVSVLFLGRSRLGAELAGLLSLSDASGLGALLPPARFNTVLANINTGLPFRETFDNYAAWSIVGMRIDPCARDRATDLTCRREIRLVAQPKVQPRSSTAGPFEDHSLHLTYVLDNDAFRAALQHLNQISLAYATTSFQAAPLGVHPLIARDGNTGPYATALKSWILKHVGDARLRRIGVNISTSLVWFMRGFDVAGAETLVRPQVCSPNPGNTWTFNPTTPSVNPTLPVPNCSETTNNVVRTRTKAAFDALSPAEQDGLVTEALLLAREDRRGVEQGDCVSCHVASRNLATWRGVAFLDANDGHPARSSLRRLRFARDRNPIAGQNMRAFGYFLDGPWVSLRTAVETGNALPLLQREVIAGAAR
jgi:hypothetical protein